MTLAHITLACRDVPVTSRFFEEVFGWLPIHRAENINQTAAWLKIAPGQQLHLLQVPEFEPSQFEAEFGRHVAVFFPGAEFTDLKDRLVRRGAEVITPKRETPFERFFFRDPNGYFFEVIDRDGYVEE